MLRFLHRELPLELLKAATNAFGFYSFGFLIFKGDGTVGEASVKLPHFRFLFLSRYVLLIMSEHIEKYIFFTVFSHCVSFKF